MVTDSIVCADATVKTYILDELKRNGEKIPRGSVLPDIWNDICKETL